jgi:hypothetical protein
MIWKKIIWKRERGDYMEEGENNDMDKGENDKNERRV